MSIAGPPGRLAPGGRPRSGATDEANKASTVSPFAVPAIVFITVVTVVIGAFGYKISRNTSDFLVASRTVSPRLNASAIWASTCPRPASSASPG